MRKSLFSVALSSFALCLCLIPAALSSPVKAKAEGEKEIVYFDIKEETANGLYSVQFKTSLAFPSLSNHDFAWYVNGEPKTSVAIFDPASPATVNLGWNGEKPAESDSYHHFHIEAGTVLGESDSARYVLKNDYNFWYTMASGGPETWCHWVYEHGSLESDFPSFVTGEVPTLTFAGEIPTETSDGAPLSRINIAEKRWDIPLPYQKGDWTGASDPYNGNVFFVDLDGSGYKMLDYASFSGGALNWYGVFSGQSSGTELGLIPFSALGSEDGTLARYASIRIPKGTLMGGFHKGYSFMVEEDAYFDIGTDGVVSGVYPSPHDYVRHPSRCGHPGNIEYYSCSHRGHEAERFLKEGETYRPCQDSEIKTDVEHEFVFVKGTPSTCDSPGKKDHYECSRCSALAQKEGESYVLVDADELLISAAHKLLDVAEIPYTCTSDGMRAHIECQACHKLYLSEGGELKEVKESDLVLPKRHTLLTLEGKAATCVEGGLSEGKQCSVCGEIVLEQRSLAALGHRYGGWELNQGERIITRLCERCYAIECVAVSEENGFTYEILVDPTAKSKGCARYHSDGYGTFCLEIPEKEEGDGQDKAQIIVSSAVCATSLGASILAPLLLKKKWAL